MDKVNLVYRALQTFPSKIAVTEFNDLMALYKLVSGYFFGIRNDIFTNQLPKVLFSVLSGHFRAS